MKPKISAAKDINAMDEVYKILLFYCIFSTMKSMNSSCQCTYDIFNTKCSKCSVYFLQKPMQVFADICMYICILRSITEGHIQALLCTVDLHGLPHLQCPLHKYY